MDIFMSALPFSTRMLTRIVHACFECEVRRSAPLPFLLAQFETALLDLCLH